MKKRTNALKLIIATAILSTTTSHGALVISLGGNGSDTSGTISISGSLTTQAAIETQNRQSIVLPRTTGPGATGYQLLGGGNIPILGDWSNGSIVGFTFDSPTAISYSYTDTSNGGAVLFSGFVTGFEPGGGDDVFQLTIDSINFFDLSIEAGDTLTIQGTSTFTTLSTFGSQLNEGTYTGSYNGQDLTLNIVP